MPQQTYTAKNPNAIFKVMVERTQVPVEESERYK